MAVVLIAVAAIAGLQSVRQAALARAADQAEEQAWQAKLNDAKMNEARETVEAELKAKADEDEKVRRAMNNAGWQSVEDNDVYYYIDEEAECSYSSCAVLGVISLRPDGCPRGASISARFLADGIVVGQDNHITPMIEYEEAAAFELKDYSGNGEQFELTELQCVGDS